MNQLQTQQIKNLTKSPEWEAVEELLREELIKMADIRTLNLETNIDEQVLGRIESVKAITKVLRRAGMLSKDPLKFNPKQYI